MKKARLSSLAEEGEEDGEFGLIRGGIVGEEETRAPPLPDMDQATAKQLFENGAFFLLENFPPGSEFGVDYVSWRVGDKFRGLKMIPPGLHFIYFSINSRKHDHEEVAPRIGFFHDFRPKEVLVKSWDAKLEDVVDVESTTSAEREMRELDPFLGPYPYQSLKAWFSLSDHMTPQGIAPILPESGRITAQCELRTAEAEALSGGASVVDRAHPTRLRLRDAQGLPIMNVAAGHELRFRPIPKAGSSGGQGRALSSAFLDRSGQLDALIGGGTEEELLGELQLAFVAFLLGRVYSAFEAWKRLLSVLCGCARGVRERAGLFSALVDVLYFQLREAPPDVFVDIVERDNFLTRVLSDLFANVQDEAGPELSAKAGRFQAYLGRKFKWDFQLEEDQPQIVQLGEA